MVLVSVTMQQRVPSFILVFPFLFTALSISLVTVSLVFNLTIWGSSFTVGSCWSAMPSAGMAQVVVMAAMALAQTQALVAATTGYVFGLQTGSFLGVIYMCDRC